MNDSVFFFVLWTPLPAALAIFSTLILKTNQTIHRNYIAELILADWRKPYKTWIYATVFAVFNNVLQKS